MAPIVLNFQYADAGYATQYRRLRPSSPFFSFFRSISFLPFLSDTEQMESEAEPQTHLRCIIAMDRNTQREPTYRIRYRGFLTFMTPRVASVNTRGIAVAFPAHGST